MKQYPLIGFSIIGVFILIFASMTNVVGYQSVQSSNKQTNNEAFKERELLFQTIVDIANNKEIQQVILKSKMSTGLFQASEIPVLTKIQIRQMYILGLILSKSFSKPTIQSLIGEYQFNSQEMQKELNAVIEKDTILNSKITQLKVSECDCENEKKSVFWNFPVVCTILFPIVIITGFLSLLFGLFFDYYLMANFFYVLWKITLTIVVTIDCYYL